MANLQGVWKYRSYCPNPVSATVSPSAPAFQVWSPQGTVTIDATGVSGILEFQLAAPHPPLKLDLTIQVTAGNPERVSIVAVAQGGLPFTNELQGWLVPADPSQALGASGPVVIRGAIVQTSAGLAPGSPPIFTTGFFILER